MSEISSPDLLILRGNRTGGGRKILTPKGYFVSVETQEEVFAGQINGAPLQDDATFGIYELAVDNTSGSAANTARHMTVEFGSTPGANNLGNARLRAAADSNSLFISEISPAALPVGDNDYFSVKRTWRPQLVLPRGVGVANGTSYTNEIVMYTDYDIAYTDQNDNFTPKANITRSATVPFAPKPAGFVDGFRTTSPQTYREMVLSSAYSFCFDDTIASRTWDVDDGTITVGSATSTTITVRFPVGFRWISLSVVSTNGAKTGVMYFPIWVHDANNMPLRRAYRQRDFTGNWRELELEFFQQDTSETTIPEGTAICCWEYDPFWGETIPDQYRDQFLGWSREDTTLFKKYESSDTLIVTGLAEWLSRYRAIPMRVYDPLTTADTWFEMEDIYNDKLAFYILENFSTANVLGNLWLSGNTDKLKSLDLTGNSLFGQVQYAVLGYQGIARCDSLNSIWIRKHYPYMTLAERAAVDQTLALTQVDRPDSVPLRLSRRRYFAVASVLGAGGSFDGATQVIYNSRAPGRTPLDSNSEQDAPGINLPVTDAQDVLNWLTGQHIGVLNNANDGVPYQTLPNLDCIEPAWDEPILISDVNPDSGYTISNKEFLVKEVNITYEDPYEGEGKRVEYSLVEVTTNAPGQMVEVIEDTTDPIDYEPPVDIYPIPPLFFPDSWSGLFADTVDLAVWQFRDQSADEASLMILIGGVHTETTFASMGISGRYVKAVVDPWSPKYINGSGAVNGWILTTEQVCRITDVVGSKTISGVFGLGLVGGDVMGQRMIHTNIAQRNLVVVTFGLTNAGIPSRDGQYVYKTTDGINWTGGKHSSHVGTSFLWVSARNAGHVYIARFESGVGNRILRSTDAGETFSSFYLSTTATNIIMLTDGVHFPYHNNADDGVFYFSEYVWVFQGGFILNGRSGYKYDHGVVTDVTVITGLSNQAGFCNFGLDSYAENQNILRGEVVRYNYTDAPAADSLQGAGAESDDGADNWTVVAASNTYVYDKSFITDNALTRFRTGRIGSLEKTIDDGDNWSDISGDLPNAGAGAGDNYIDMIWGI